MSSVSGRRTGRGPGARLVLTVVLAVVFFGSGLAKVVAAPTLVQTFSGWGLPLWTMYLVGTLEIVGAVGLWLPRVRGLAALGLVGLMLGAIVTHLRVGEIPSALVPLLAAGLAGGLAWVRLGEERALRRARATAGSA